MTAEQTDIMTLTSEQAPDSPSRLSWQMWLDPLGAAQQQIARNPDLFVFDKDRFISELSSQADRSADADHFRAHVLDICKAALKTMRENLAARLHHNRDGADYVGMHALAMDVLISSVSDLISHHYFADAPPVAILATGGYGRGELAPFSDIDLLFVTSAPAENNPQNPQTAFIEAILYLLWDMGLKVGHATRTVSENLISAKHDTTICTSLIEMRVIGGHRKLANRMMSEFHKWLSAQAVPDFVGAKLAERDQRIARNGGTRYAVEPNVKDGKGGLRDLHTLFWIAKYAYRLGHISEVLKTDILRPSEARKFASSQRFLWTVRCFLHLHHGREDDRLSFDAQSDIAPLMRFADRGGLRAVERFMKRYFLAARQVGNLTRIFCAALESDFAGRQRFSLHRLLHSALPRQTTIHPFIIEGGRLHLPQQMLFRDDFELIITLFSHAQSHKLDIHPDSFRRLTRAIRWAHSPDFQTPRTHQIFLEILTSPETPERVLRMMNESGWLGLYMPDFGRIVGMMQFDMYHSYTVDEHTIKAVGFVNDIETGQLADVAPLASSVISKISSRRALYVAMLLHDIAKGRGGDHSVLGAEVAAQLCPLMGLSDEETETVIWLIRWHLLMSKTAFRYDLNDPKTISDFAAQVQSPERLKLLLCLTVADIQAVGPSVWNGWKASLMRDLYHRAAAVLGGAAPTEVSSHAVADAINRVSEALSDWSPSELDGHISSFYPSYWTNFSTRSHLHHASLVRRFDASDNQILVDFKDEDDRKSTVMCVMASDHPGLFSRIVGAVAMTGCSIMNARINTRHNGTILDQFRIQKGQQTVSDSAVKKRIARLIEQSLAGELSLFSELQEKTARLSRRVKVMDVPPRVIVTNARSNTHTVIEVNGADRPGLLYQITYHLAQLNLQINSATVSTYGEKAVDVFYVKDVFGLQVTRPAAQDKIRDRLMAVLSPDKGSG